VRTIEAAIRAQADLRFRRLRNRAMTQDALISGMDFVLARADRAGA
jgi:hypothetical protein